MVTALETPAVWGWGTPERAPGSSDNRPLAGLMKQLMHSLDGSISAPWPGQLASPRPAPHADPLQPPPQRLPGSISPRTQHSTVCCLVVHALGVHTPWLRPDSTCLGAEALAYLLR